MPAHPDKTPRWARPGAKARHIPTGQVVRITAIAPGNKATCDYKGNEDGAQCAWGDLRDGGRFSQNFGFSELEAI